MRLLECFKARRRRTRMIARAKWLVTQMDRKAIAWTAASNGHSSS